jgi:hypothetical protein
VQDTLLKNLADVQLLYDLDLYVVFVTSFVSFTFLKKDASLRVKSQSFFYWRVMSPLTHFVNRGMYMKTYCSSTSL